MREIKSAEDLKRAFYVDRLGMGDQFTEQIIAGYGDEPATMGEAFFLLHQRIRDLLSLLPVIGRLVK